MGLGKLLLLLLLLLVGIEDFGGLVAEGEGGFKEGFEACVCGEGRKKARRGYCWGGEGCYRSGDVGWGGRRAVEGLHGFADGGGRSEGVILG